jgi:hypothetical protein
MAFSLGGHGRLRQVWQLRPSSGDLHHHAGQATSWAVKHGELLDFS